MKFKWTVRWSEEHRMYKVQGEGYGWCIYDLTPSIRSVRQLRYELKEKLVKATGKFELYEEE